MSSRCLSMSIEVGVSAQPHLLVLTAVPIWHSIAPIFGGECYKNAITETHLSPSSRWSSPKQLAFLRSLPLP